MATVVSFDGEPLGPDQAIDVDFFGQAEYGWGQTINILELIDRPAEILARSFRSWRIPVVIRPGDAAPANRALWRRDVNRVFNPNKGARTLVAEGSGPLDLEVSATVENLQVFAGTTLSESADTALLATLVIPEIAWRVTPVNAAEASPVDVGGNHPAQPELILTPTAANCGRIRLYAADGDGARGFANHWVMWEGIDTTGYGATDPEHYELFFRGRPHPVYVSPRNNAASKVQARLNIPAGGIDDDCYADLYVGSAISNTVTSPDQFEYGGISVDDADLALDHMVWDDLRVSIFPDVDFSPRGGVVGEPQGSFGITQQGATVVKGFPVGDITITAGGPGVYDEAANAIVCVLGSEVAAGEVFGPLTASITLTGGTTGVGYMRLLYRIAGSAIWQPATYDGGTTAELIVFVSGSTFETWTGEMFAMEGAVEWALALTTAGDLDGIIEMTVILGSGTTVVPLEVDLDTDFLPVVSADAAVDAFYLATGSITNETNDEVITLSEMFWDAAATLEIDTIGNGRRPGVYPSSGPYNVRTQRGGPVPTNRRQWMTLVEGDSSGPTTNTLTAVGAFALTIRWFDRVLE